MSANTITAIWRYGFITGVLAAVLAFIAWLFMPQPPKQADSKPVTEIREVTRQSQASKLA